jgi:GDP-D-mannose 3', 5'-epimerase
MLTSSKTALVCGAGGFIGHHLVRRLKQEGFWVRGVDLRYPRFSDTAADDFMIGDLRDQSFVRDVLDQHFDEIYQLAADMGGAGYIFTGDHDAEVMHNSSSINLNVLQNARKHKNKRIFYSSSACIYPEHNQRDPNNPTCAEASAYPAAPDSEYGWEKLFSERLYLAYARNFEMEVRIARYHNIFGPEGSWNDGKEKAPAAICRKVAMACDGGEIEVWGDGKQTRSFLYIDACLEGTLRLMRSNFTGPVNLGSEDLVSVNQLVDIIAGIAGKSLDKRHVDGPMGVRGRKSDNRLIREKLGWAPVTALVEGLKPTYEWIRAQVMRDAGANDAAVAGAAVIRETPGSREKFEGAQVA